MHSVVAASLGQVYKATLRGSGEEVAVKVQRPFVLETVSLDLHLARSLGLLVRSVNAESAKRLDIVALLDEARGRGDGGAVGGCRGERKAELGEGG